MGVSSHPRTVASSGRLLGEGFTLPFEKTVPRLGTLELTLHGSQRLPRGEDSFTILQSVSGELVLPASAVPTPAPDMLAGWVRKARRPGLVA